ncbi:MAG TPA: hypothetical protein ENN61_02960, partial [Bacteroidaceae bacterium]|nr:hypothetical protein [Bacteroidaceae bacterium]
MAAGAVKAAEWGTALPVGAGAGVLIEDDGGLGGARKQAYLPAKEADTPLVMEGDLGPIDPVEFSPAFTMRYDPGALGTLIALLFGTAGAPAQQGSTAAYKHTLQWADAISGLFATFVVERPGKIWEVASAKVQGLELSIGDGLLKGAINLKGNTIIDNSAVNTSTQVDALTYKDRGNRIKFTQGAIKMNAQTGGDVASETALEVNEISVSYQRPTDGLHAAGAATIIEPNENDQGNITIKLGFPRMNTVNANFLASFIDRTEQKVLVTFEGAVIADPYKYT